MADILQKIASYKRDEVRALRASMSASDLDATARAADSPRGFLAALERKAATGPALIAEIKKASPSKGLIRKDFTPAKFAKNYEAGGAACLSVLTDKPSFKGSPKAFTDARAACALPALRKDFMVDPIQVTESRAMGADCVLIIMAMIDDVLAADLLAAATNYGMDALIETHTPMEVERALKLGGRLLGINNRNLKTFETKLSTFGDLSKNIPADAFLVAESAIFTADDIMTLAAAGAQGYLVGESLMRETDVELATRRLLGQTQS